MGTVLRSKKDLYCEGDLMKEIVIRKHHSIVIHPKALQAAKFAQSLSQLFPTLSLSESLAFDFQSVVVKTVEIMTANLSPSAAVFGAFSPIPLLIRAPLTINEYVASVVRFNSKKLPEEDIEFQAWCSVFVHLKTSVDSTSNLYQIWQLLNDLVPEHILISYFGKKKISQQYLAKLTGHSLATLKHGKPLPEKEAKAKFDGFNFMNEPDSD